jgi:hypothetical protein
VLYGFGGAFRRGKPRLSPIACFLYALIAFPSAFIRAVSPAAFAAFLSTITCFMFCRTARRLSRAGLWCFAPAVAGGVVVDWAERLAAPIVSEARRVAILIERIGTPERVIDQTLPS